jgi:membrane associated rhomboid family serine protease
MLPIRDNVRSSTFPVVTKLIIVVNVLIFMMQWGMPVERLEQALFFWGIVPRRYTDPDASHFFTPFQQALPFVSSMFLHGGWMHLLSNMWTLWIFGDNVEDRLGRARYLALYLASGFAAALVHIYTNRYSPIPTIGASGAIAGVMGAYFRFYPHAKVQMLVPPFFLGPIFVVPAVLFLGWWFFLQFFNGAFSLLARQTGVGGIAWWAHIGGFVFGLIVSLFFARTRRKRYEFEPVS